MVPTEHELEMLQFLDKYTKELDSNDFDTIYKNCWPANRAIITNMFEKCGIDYYNYLTFLPNEWKFDTKATTIHIPEKIKMIADEAFLYMPNVNQLVIEDPDPQIDFSGLPHTRIWKLVFSNLVTTENDFNSKFFMKLPAFCVCTFTDRESGKQVTLNYGNKPVKKEEYRKLC